MRGNEASDLETLTALSRDPEIRKLAHGRRRMRMLWDACQIPDFRKLADDTHARLCARVFSHVATDTALPTDWLAAQIAGLDRADGDIDTLMQRLSGVRVWSYIAARSDWVKDSLHWQAKAREVEDKLSDALHESLTTRFVDRRAAHLMRRLEAGEGDDLLSAVTLRGEVVVEGHEVGRIEGFGFVPDPAAVGDEKKLVLRAARRALRAEMPRRVGVLEAACADAFRADRGSPARMAGRGDRPPQSRQDSAAAGGAGARQRVPRRRVAGTGAGAAAGLAGRRNPRGPCAPLRGRGDGPGHSGAAWTAAPADGIAGADPRRRR